MGSISLRAYNREIESQIEQGYYDQAVAHSKYILKYFPKDIDAYRLLGKAYLESQRYGDAADIFQRVLSSIPEDFVSNVGMSIVREDEGNLDEAIWHMERAFENQPANNAIQSELKRLYGRRDGVEPPKINLTRGALARMYTKGGLYQQAIAELRISLAEDPQRLDLQALLAKAYYQNDQKVEAAETCNLLLGKLPYCLDANLILSDILTESNRSDEAKPYRSRLYSLNPYMAHISDTSTTADQVPENAVTLERMDDQSQIDFKSEEEQPAWASTLGLKMDDQDNEIPDWLSDDAPKSTSEEIPEEFSTVFQQDPMDSKADLSRLDTLESDEQISDSIPDWMKEAGWEHLSPDAEQIVEPFHIEDEDIQSDELADADIPDWLKTLAPKDHALTPETQNKSSEEYQEESLPWLDEFPPGPTDSIALWLGEKSTQEDSESPDDDRQFLENTPDWIQEMTSKSGIDVEIQASNDDLIRDNEIIEQEEEDNIQSQHQEDIPAWLKEMESSMEADDTLLPWLETADAAIDSSIQPDHLVDAPSIEKEEIIPEWLSESGSVENIKLESTSESILNDLNVQQVDELIHEDLPDWLSENNFDDQKTVEKTFSPRLEDNIPSWLSEDSSDTIAVQPEDDFIHEVIHQTEQSNNEFTPLKDDFDHNSVSLEDIFTNDMVDNDDKSSELSIEKEEIPDSIEDTKPVKVDNIENISTQGLEGLSESDSDAAFAWLESLAAKQGADEALLLKPEERLEEPPDWVMQLSEDGDDFSQALKNHMDTETDQPIIDDEKLPDWLTQSAANNFESDNDTQALPDSTPDWLKFEDETSSDINNEYISETTAQIDDAELIQPIFEKDTPDISSIVDDISMNASLETTITEFQEEITKREPSKQTEVDQLSKTELETSTLETSSLLEKARHEFASGSLQTALEIYAQLIKSRQSLPHVIIDINENLYQHPLEINLWVSLGDAYMQSDELQQALDAYKKAEELLR